MPTTLLALDGPLNGDYIDEDTASANDYSAAEWAPGEWAYLHTPTMEEHMNEDGVPSEILDEINDTLDNS